MHQFYIGTSLPRLPTRVSQVSGSNVKQLCGQVEAHQLRKAHLAQDKHVPASATAQIEQRLISGRVKQPDNGLDIGPRLCRVTVCVQL
jgi:hypothetical protein